MDDVSNGYQAFARFLNVATMPSTLLVLMVMIVALAIVPDPAVAVTICTVMAGLFLASQTTVGIVKALNPPENTHIHLGHDVPLES